MDAVIDSPVVALGCVAASLLCCGLVLKIEGQAFNRFFVLNLAFAWMPQGLLILGVMLINSHSACFAGATLAAFAVYAGFCYVLRNDNGLGVIRVVFSWPGAMIVAGSAAALILKYPLLNAATAAGITAAAVIIGTMASGFSLMQSVRRKSSSAGWACAAVLAAPLTLAVLGRGFEAYRASRL